MNTHNLIFGLLAIMAVAFISWALWREWKRGAIDRRTRQYLDAERSVGGSEPMLDWPKLQQELNELQSRMWGKQEEANTLLSSRLCRLEAASPSQAGPPTTATPTREGPLDARGPDTTAQTTPPSSPSDPLDIASGPVAPAW